MAGENDEARGILADIERCRRDRSAIDLSRDHTPIAILLKQQCIISTLHFRHLESRYLKQEAFRQAVYYIDIEMSSQCNRKCLHCPNSQNDRFTSNEFMSDATFRSFMYDLGSIDYRREIHLVGYNEPLLYTDDILDRLELARCAVPEATIVVFTNGDCLEREHLPKLIAAGANEIIVSVHLPPGKPYNDESIFARINEIADRLGTPITPLTYIKDAQITARLVYEGIKITVRQTDYDRYGSNRTGTLDGVGPTKDVRTAACLMPIYQFIVGHKGVVVPCCVMVSDDPRNSQYLMGNICETPDIFDTYCGPRFVAWRRSLYNLAPKQAPCTRCAWDATSPLLNAPALYDPWQQLVSPPLVDPVLVG